MTINKETLAEDRRVAEAAVGAAERQVNSPMTAILYEPCLRNFTRQFNPAAMLERTAWMEELIEENERLKADYSNYATMMEGIVEAQAKRIEELESCLKFYAHDGMLQTFESRELFRKAAWELLKDGGEGK